MKALSDCYRLSNGVDIPCVGLGTWQTQEGGECRDAVLEAVRAGYRHIDTASAYGNERSVGDAVKACGVPRGELFITSKLGNDDRGYDETIRAFDLTMSRLGLDYLDLYLIHWPSPEPFRERIRELTAETWRAFEALYTAGRVRAIGVSNFLPHHISELMESAGIAPMVNQIRLCPGDTQDECVSFCRAQGILLEAYSPLGTGEIFKVPEMLSLAEKYGRTVAQICVRWSLQQGFLPLPKSVRADRIRENADVFGFELSDEDCAKIAGLTGCCGYSINPDTAWF